MARAKQAAKPKPKPKPKLKEREHKGWERGKPRKLPSITVKRATVSLCDEDLDRMVALGNLHPELRTDGDVLRYALEVAARVEGAP